MSGACLIFIATDDVTERVVYKLSPVSILIFATILWWNKAVYKPPGHACTRNQLYRTANQRSQNAYITQQALFSKHNRIRRAADQ